MAQHRTKESRPRQGEILIYRPAEGKGEIYGTKEGKAFRFDLKSSPGLNPDLLRPGIPVTYVTVHSDDGARAVEVQLEEAGSLETRLRSTRKRLGGKPSRPAGMQAPTVVIPAVSDTTEAAPEADATDEAPAEVEAPDEAVAEVDVPEEAAAEAEAPGEAAAEADVPGEAAAEADVPGEAAEETVSDESADSKGS